MPTRIQIATALALVLTCGSLSSGQNKGFTVAQEAAQKEREEQLDAQAQQYVQMMNPLMWRELEFVRQTCDLKPEQRPKIKAAGEAGVKQAARDMISPRGGGARTPATAGQSIRERIVKVLKESLTAEQLARYEAEEAKRRAADKQASIASAVATIDGALFLTKEQRDKVVEQLNANWHEDWEQWLQMWQYAGQYYPQVPDTYIVPHLNEEQKTVWRGLQKVSFSSWGGGMERQAADDEWWEGKPAAGKAKGKAKAKAKAD
jgi:hypothetical protein